MKRYLPGVWIAALLCGAVWAAVPEAGPQEAQLIAVLQSGASPQDKANACRELARVGTKQAVPALAALLADEQLSHLARYGLEPIADPAVDSVLRAALGNLKGRPLVGVIGSIGVRRDAAATAALAELLTAADADVAQAAARALGSIGTPAAAGALQSALGKGADAQERAVGEGLLRCAAVLPPAEALKIYDRLRHPPEPLQIRAAALRGAILARPQDGVALLAAELHDDESALAGAAVRAALEMPGEAVTLALASEAGKLAGERQQLLIQTLGARGDAAAVPALLTLAQSGTTGGRVAAMRALTQIGNASVVPAFAQMALESDAEVASAARAGLGSLSGSAVDAALTGMLAAADPKTQLVALDLISQRRLTSALPALLRLAESTDPALAAASLKALGELAGPAEVPALLKILLTTPATAAAENALTLVCTRPTAAAGGQLVIQKAVYGDLPDGPSADVTKKVAELVGAGTRTVEASNEEFGDPAGGAVKELRVDYTANGTPGTQTVKEGESMTFTVNAPPPACASVLVAAVAQAQPQPKMALLRILRAAGGPEALAATRAATKDTNLEVRETAWRNLCEWRTAEVLPDLEELMGNPPSAKFKILALRGELRLIPLQTGTPAQKFVALQPVLARVERPEEKRLALAALGEIPTAEALDLVLKELPNAALKEEACQAAVAIGEQLVSTAPAVVGAALRQVVKTTENTRVAKRARAVLKTIKS